MRDAPRRGVALLSLAGILLLAAAVCALHVVNALTLRGTARVSDYTLLARAEQDMAVDEALFGAAQRSTYTDGTRSFALALTDPALEDGVLCISGALLRRPNVSVYLSVLLALIYYRTVRAPADRRAADEA